jgi:hypothetical protein
LNSIPPQQTASSDPKYRILGGITALAVTLVSFLVGKVLDGHAGGSALLLSTGGGVASGAAISAYVCRIAEREHKQGKLLTYWRALVDFGLASGALWVGLSGASGATGNASAWPVVVGVVVLWTTSAFVFERYAR